MNATRATAPLVGVLHELGYTENMRQIRVGSPACSAVADIVAFTQDAPHDLRTSAISAFTSPANGVDELLDAARLLATPFALIEDPLGDLGLYSVTSTGDPTATLVRWIAPTEIPELRRSELAAELAPRAIHAAKAGVRQLTLFPIDAALLVDARDRSVGSISSRLEKSFGLALRGSIDTTSAARLVIESLAVMIVRDKYQFKDIARSGLVDAALARHGEYFAELAEWQGKQPHLVESVFDELGDGVDYSAIDARSINAVYEKLFLTPQLRRDLGIFHTGHRLASRILDHLPVEEIPPEDRFVVDTACGAGNLLLAAQERLENLSPGDWSPEDTHRWLKTHIYGSDIEPIAVEIAKLSLLVSSLPMGNSWRIERRDALDDTVNFDPPPTIWVTNPPWLNQKGARDELAIKFLSRALEATADGGLLAVILPVAWLSARQHRESRHEITSQCNLFEVWRLPRDMFNDARVPAAVVFAQKRRTARRSHFAFRWLTAGANHRADFLDSGVVQFQSTEDAGADAAFVGGPVDGVAATGITVGAVAGLSGGVVQKGTPQPARRGEGLPFLARGAQVDIHRSIDTESITWVSDPGENLLTRIHRGSHLLDAPKLLVQADRFPDNAWRLRPVVDLTGVVPSNTWQVLAGQPQTVWALNAYLSTSIASCFVQSRATTKRISLDVLSQIPLPPDWRHRHERQFADLGRHMAHPASDLPSLVDEAEQMARRALELDDSMVAAIERVMAGFEAPDGRIRFQDVAVPLQAGGSHAGEFNQAPGTVLGVERTTVRIWVLGGPDEGFTIDLHEGIPGWLLEEDSSFELTGDPQTGLYRFHRVAHLSDEQVFGVVDEDLEATADEEHDSGDTDTRRRRGDRLF